MATIRQQITALLSENGLNAREISQLLSIGEKEVYEHLSHIRRSAALHGKRLCVEPYECLACGYIFKKRQRLKRPGRCPKCKGSHIRMAVYRIEPW